MDDHKRIEMETQNDYETVKRIIMDRRSIRKYLDKEIPLEELKEVISLAQRAPSSYNVQPYRVIIVRSKEDKEKLAPSMMLNNAEYVRTASATLIVCSDMNPAKRLQEVTELEKENGASDEAASFAERTFLHGLKSESCWSHLKEAITGSYWKGTPNSIEGWSYKNCGFFMQQFVLLAQSKEWGTLYMGGFDAIRIKRSFGIPRDYDVCCTIAVGYPDDSEKYHEHPRYPPNMVYYENTFGEPTKTTIPEIKQTYFWKSA